MTMPGVGESSSLRVSSSNVAAIREKLNQKGGCDPPSFPGTYFSKTSKPVINVSPNDRKKTANNNSSFERSPARNSIASQSPSKKTNSAIKTNDRAKSSLQVLMPKPYQPTRTPSPNTIDSDDSSAKLEKSDSMSSVNTTTSKSSTDDVPKSYISEMKSKFENSSSNGDLSTSSNKTAQEMGEMTSVSQLSNKFDSKCSEKKPGLLPKPPVLSKTTCSSNSDGKTKQPAKPSLLPKAQTAVKTNPKEIKSNATSKSNRNKDSVDASKETPLLSTKTSVNNVKNNKTSECAKKIDPVEEEPLEKIQRPSVAQLATAFSPKKTVPNDKIVKSKLDIAKVSESFTETEIQQKNELPPELPPKGVSVQNSRIRSNSVESVTNHLNLSTEIVVYNFKNYRRKSLLECDPGPPPPKPFKPAYMTLKLPGTESHNTLPPVPPLPLNFTSKRQDPSINERIRNHRPPPQPPSLSEICRKPLPPPPPEEENEDSATDYYDDSFDDDDDDSPEVASEHHWIHSQFRDTFNTSDSVSCSSSSYEPLHNCESFASTDELSQEQSDEQDIYEVVDTDTVDNSYIKSPISDNDKIEEARKRQDEKKLKQELKEKDKRHKELMKSKEKFNLKGEIVKLESGVVKKNCRGRNLNLSVKAGERVYIIRINGNPPGKWLVQNDKDRIGYVDLTNIDINPDAIRNVMSAIQNLPLYSDLDTDDIYQSIA